MRNAILSMPDPPSPGARRAAFRAAIRQLERADLYLGAVAAMDLGDRDARRALNQIRADVDSLRHHFVDIHSET